MTANTVFAAGSLVGAPVRRVEDPDLLTGRRHLHRRPRRRRHARSRVRPLDGRARRTRVVDTSDAPRDARRRGRVHRRRPRCPRYSRVHDDPPRSTGRRSRETGCGSSATSSRWSSPRPRSQAVDAAEAVIVDYDPLPGRGRHRGRARGRRAGAVRRARARTLATATRGPTTAMLDDADVVVRGRIVNQRVAAVPMEAAAIVVVPGDAGAATTSRLTSRARCRTGCATSSRRHARSRPARSGVDRAAVGGGVRRQDRRDVEYSIVGKAALRARSGR